MRTSIFLAAACVTGLCITSALAQSGGAMGGSMSGPSTPPARTNFCGPVVKLTEASCIGVKNMMPVITYNITSANPKPPVGMMITGSGVKSGGVSICMEGTILTDVKWQKAAACPLAK